MFPAYAGDEKSKSNFGVSWLQCPDFRGTDGSPGAKSESSDSDDELVHALERQRCRNTDGRAQKRDRSPGSDSSPAARREHGTKHHKKHKKKDKKHRKDKKHKKQRKRSRSRSPDASYLKRKWAFLEDIGPTKITYIVDPKGDQSNKAFEQLPHTCAAVYKVRREFRPRKKTRRYFKAKMSPPSMSIAVNEKLRALKTTSYISLGSALLDEDNDSELPSWPSLIKEHADLSNRCRKEPGNVELWLKLCEFERVFVPCSLAGSNIDAQALRKAILEKQLSVMAEAISKNPVILKLRLKKFDLLCALDRQDELSREWDDVLRMSDYSIERRDLKNEMWLKYAQYARSKFRVVAKFSLEDATAGYRRAIEAYRRTRSDDMFLVDLIADYADFLVECGHTEKAVSTFQAMLDFNLSQPGYLSTERNEDALKKMFELFWESGSPRVGENDHVGWALSNDNPHLEPPEENRNFKDEDEITSSAQPLNVKWAMLELHRQKTQWRPAKINAEDVEQIVLFDDIEMFLFRTRDRLCIRKLLSAFMSHLSRGDRSYLGHDEGSSKMHQLLKLPFAKLELQGLSTLLYNCYRTGMEFLPEFPWPEELLDRLLDLAPHSGENLIALGKKILQDGENQSNILIWTKLLLLLACCGQRDEAISKGVKLMRTLSASLKSFRGDPLNFLATFIEIHLDIHHLMTSEIHENVTEIPDLKPLFSFWGALVQGRRATLSEIDEGNMEFLRAHLRNQRTEFSIEIATFFELTSRGPLEAYSYLSSQASHLSKAAYHRLNILLHVLVNKHFSPSLTSLKSTLRLACTERPTKEHLALLATLAYKNPLAWRSCPIPQDDAEISWFSILLFHLLRNQEYEDWQKREEVSYYRAPLGSVRRAMSQLGEIRDPLFWRLQAWAEMQAGERDKAKELLLRGLQTCPWSKALFLDCALYFEDMLEQIVDSLTEKGLRLRTPIEEIQLLTETSTTEPVSNE
ncbi:protein NRDE2 homolog [Galendromus occidentalis]|uniref:Protein NRDE2 homolog n=1 Tax=Galendromus occidentalis TaxID=34638 RepID=A0AAJ6VX54_9ACAR|nr:protein NRDE2 homolog [Galendromus occidentalis]